MNMPSYPYRMAILINIYIYQAFRLAILMTKLMAKLAKLMVKMAKMAKRQGYMRLAKLIGSSLNPQYGSLRAVQVPLGVFKSRGIIK